MAMIAYLSLSLLFAFLYFLINVRMSIYVHNYVNEWAAFCVYRHALSIVYAV